MFIFIVSVKAGKVNKVRREKVRVYQVHHAVAHFQSTPRHWIVA